MTWTFTHWQYDKVIIIWGIPHYITKLIKTRLINFGGGLLCKVFHIQTEVNEVRHESKQFSANREVENCQLCIVSTCSTSTEVESVPGTSTPDRHRRRCQKRVLDQVWEMVESRHLRRHFHHSIRLQHCVQRLYCVHDKAVISEVD